MAIMRAGSSSPSSKDIVSSNPKTSEEHKKVSKKSIVVKSKLGSGGKSGTSTETGKRK